MRTTVYIAFANLFRRFSGLALTLLVVVTADAEDFVRYGLLTSAVVIFTSLFSLNCCFAVERLYFDTQDRRDHATLLLNSLIFGGVGISLGTVLLVVVTPFSPWISTAFGGNQLVIVAFAGLCFLSFACQLVQTVFRIANDLHAYAVSSLVQGAGLFVVYLGLMWGELCTPFTAIMLALAVSLGLGLLPGLIRIRHLLANGRFDGVVLRSMLKYSAPTLAHGAGCWVLLMMGRWMGAQELGLAAIAGFMMLSQVYGNFTVLPRVYYETKAAESGALFGRGAHNDAIARIRQWTIRLLFFTVIAYLIAGAAYGVSYAYLPTVYQFGIPTLMCVAAISLLDVVALASERALFGLKRTAMASTVSFSAGVVAIIVLSLFIPWFGMDGLLYGTCVGFFSQALFGLFAVRYVLKKSAPRA